MKVETHAWGSRNGFAQLSIKTGNRRSLEWYLAECLPTEWAILLTICTVETHVLLTAFASHCLSLRICGAHLEPSVLRCLKLTGLSARKLAVNTWASWSPCPTLHSLPCSAWRSSPFVSKCSAHCRLCLHPPLRVLRRPFPCALRAYSNFSLQHCFVLVAGSSLCHEFRLLCCAFEFTVTSKYLQHYRIHCIYIIQYIVIYNNLQ